MSVLFHLVLLYSKYFKVVQGHVAPSAPADARSVSDRAGFLVYFDDKNRHKYKCYELLFYNFLRLSVIFVRPSYIGSGYCA